MKILHACVPSFVQRGSDAVYYAWHAFWVVKIPGVLGPAFNALGFIRLVVSFFPPSFRAFRAFAPVWFHVSRVCPAVPDFFQLNPFCRAFFESRKEPSGHPGVPAKCARDPDIIISDYSAVGNYRDIDSFFL